MPLAASSLQVPSSGNHNLVPTTTHPNTRTRIPLVSQNNSRNREQEIEVGKKTEERRRRVRMRRKGCKGGFKTEYSVGKKRNRRGEEKGKKDDKKRGRG